MQLVKVLIDVLRNCLKIRLKKIAKIRKEDRGNTVSLPRSLTCENVADLVDSLGESYTIYRSTILKYAIDGAILIEYSTVDDKELNSFFAELEVTSGIHR
jgi:alkyl hydroperoxide reductase subunit AhpF